MLHCYIMGFISVKHGYIYMYMWVTTYPTYGAGCHFYISYCGHDYGIYFIGLLSYTSSSHHILGFIMGYISLYGLHGCFIRFYT